VVDALEVIAELVATARDPSALQGRGETSRARRLCVTLLQMLALAGLGAALYWWGPAAVDRVRDQIETYRAK
jgi:hypothetical protein